MNSIFNSLLRALGVLTFLFLMGGISAVADEVGVFAESWPLDPNNPDALKGTFEMSRRQNLTPSAARVQLDKLEIPARANPALTRVRGVLIPPHTGGYTFSIIGDDESELWLLDDETGEWKVTQVKWNHITGVGRVRLQQGVAKRFEFWTKGDKEISVQWEACEWEPAVNGTGSRVKREIMTKQVIPAASMRARMAREGEHNGDGLKDAWKQQRGLDLNSDDGLNGPWGDPDGDGLLNWQEQIAGTDPKQADAEGASSLVRWEIWRNIPGKYVFDLTRSTNFPQTPDEIRYLHRLEITPGNGMDYGSRLRGWVKAPITGEYTFMIIANDTAELWLGESDLAESRKMLARVEQSGAQSRWTRTSEGKEVPLMPEQISKRITLEQGKSYYLEILHKQALKEDHCSVGWIIPGQSAPQKIGAEALVAWKPNNTGQPPVEAPPTVKRGELKVDSWENLPGDTTEKLVHSSNYPASPSRTSTVDNLDFSDEGNNWGCRLRGYLTAPEDGPYLFYISGKDACTLFLSDSEDKFHKKEIASTPKGTNWRSYGPSYSQHSDSMELKKGQKYYIEVLFKRGQPLDPINGEYDHASVGWKRPGRHGMNETVIDAEYFSPYQADSRDLDDNDLPDEWERAKGLTDLPSTQNGAWGDPDGDWLENFREYQAGLNPKLADVHGAPGLALWECWENTPGNSISTLINNPAFPFSPTLRKWVTRLEGPQGHGESYGSRLRAFLIPPISGTYTFAISGDDRSELWLSGSESKFSKERIAFVDSESPARDWSTTASQESRSIQLEAGKRYYIEVLHKQNNQDDHVSAAWKIPGADDYQIIQDSALAGYYYNDPNDLNGDDLPDDWEKLNGLAANAVNRDKDTDGDGLTDREEFLLGTRADKVDTDGDGQTDLDEIRNFKTNPMVADNVGPAVSTVGLGSYISSSSNWNMTSGGLLADGYRGEIAWKFTVPSDGNWLLRLKTELLGRRMGSEQVPMVVMIDGQVVARRDIYYGVGSQATFQALTQYLNGGEHQVSLLVDNMLARRSVRLVSLNVFAPGNLTGQLAQANRMAGNAAGTRTSPFCIEGFARDVSMVKIDGEAVKAGTGGGHWYYNMSLAEQDDSQPYTVEFERNSEVAARITWERTNALAGETLTVRMGDSLRVGAWGNAADMPSVLLSSTGETWNLTGSGTVAIPFPNAGAFTLKGTLQDGSTGTLTVNVIAPPNFTGGYVDTLDRSTRTIVYAATSTIEFESAPELVTLKVARLDTQSASVSMLPLAAREFGVLARAGKGGPILAMQRINVIGLSDAVQNSLTSVGTSSVAGYKTYTTPLTVTNLPEGGRVDVSVLRAGVMFPNGTTLRTITPADLINGSTLLTFLFPTGLHGSYCHQLLVYGRKGEYLGTR